MISSVYDLDNLRNTNQVWYRDASQIESVLPTAQIMGGGRAT